MAFPRKGSRALTVALALAWPVAALLMATANDPGSLDPSAAEYGMNFPGDLRDFLMRAAIETAVLVLILRPWSFHRSAGRVLLALVLFLPWTALHLITGLHGGPVMHRHELWLFLVCLGLIGGLFSLGGTALRRRLARTHTVVR